MSKTSWFGLVVPLLRCNAVLRQTYITHHSPTTFITSMADDGSLLKVGDRAKLQFLSSPAVLPSFSFKTVATDWTLNCSQPCQLPAADSLSQAALTCHNSQRWCRKSTHWPLRKWDEIWWDMNNYQCLYMFILYIYVILNLQISKKVMGIIELKSASWVSRNLRMFKNEDKDSTGSP